MEKSTMYIVIGVVVCVFIYFTAQTDRANLQNERYYNCITAMNKAMPDQNDDSRASFLAECQK